MVAGSCHISRLEDCSVKVARSQNVPFLLQAASCQVFGHKDYKGNSKGTLAV